MISYQPLMKILKDRNISKTELRENVGFSTRTLAKLAKNEYISMETIEKICDFLKVPIYQVITIQNEKQKELSDMRPNEIDLDEILNIVIRYKENDINENDRRIIKGIIEGYFQSKKNMI